MIKVSRMQMWGRCLLVASVAALGIAALASPARAASIPIGFNPTGGGIGGTTNFGSLTIQTIDELPGNAIAVGFNKAAATSPTGFRLPTVGETFNLLYQANVGNLLNASGNPVFGYGVSGPPPTGQLTAVASFTELVTSVSAATGSATFQTVGGGTFNFYFNPTRAADNLAGTDFAPGTPGNTLAVGTYTTVYTGSIIGGAGGNFSSTSAAGTNAGPLDQNDGNNYPGVTSIAGSGGTNLSVQTTSYSSAFFTSAPPAPLLVQLFNTSNNLPYNQVDPSAIFFNGQSGVASVGPNNGGASAAGFPLAANVMFQADANSSFSSVPEPRSILTALTGFVFVFLAGLQRRTKTAAV